jgi:hypothetical protein
MIQGIGLMTAQTRTFACSFLAVAVFSGVSRAQTLLNLIPMTPCRVVDTRNATGPFGGPSIAAGGTRSFALTGSTACSIPTTAAAWSLNVTVVPHGVLGYVTIWPAGQSQPTVSTLNSYLGEVKANAAIVPAGTGGAVSVFASDATDVILDIDGYFVPGTENATALAFYPLTPCRVADTRNANGPLGGPSMGAETSRAFPVQSATSCNVPASAQAYSLNFTVVPRTSVFSYLTTWPAGESQPLVSTLNAYTGTVTANAAIVPAGAGGQIEVYVTDAADVVLDIDGYFAPPGEGGLSLYTLAPCRALDTRQPPGSLPFSGSLNVNVEASGCGAPSSAPAYVLNATVVPQGILSYLTLWAEGAPQPLVSTLNADEGTVTSNMAIVPTTNGSISTFVTNPTYLILDILGAFVPANYSPTLYSLSVVNGSGSGSYAAGTPVTITANAPPAGESFVDWTGATVTNSNASSTILTMPAANTSVTANYAPTYALTVVNGTGSGSYLANAVVPISANAPPAGEAFLEWTGATVAGSNAASTTITMPAANTTVTANYSSQQSGSTCADMSLGDNASLNGFVPFPSNYAWNTDISQAPLDPNNQTITSAAGFAGLHLHHDFSSVAGGNYGIPYVVVDSSSTPLFPINVIDYADQSDVASAPYPFTAPIEGSPADCDGWPDTYVGDSHVLVLDRHACVLYETFNTHRCNGAWNASSETIWDMQSDEMRPWGWTSGDAAGLSIFAGLLRYDEVAAGAVNHAIRFTMQQTKNDANGGYFVEPATHAAGTVWGVSNVMGMRIRLKADFDISGYSAANQAILTAMKKYGMILADNGGYFFFQGAPDPRWNDDDLENLDSIQSFNFEVVQMDPVFPGWDTATAPTGQPPTIGSFTASASTVTAGTPVTLTWETSNDSYDFIDVLGGVHGGSVTTTPTSTTMYTLNATNQYGRSTAQVTVTVK